MWLRDILPRPDRIPSARIMTFGYVSEPPEAISAEGIRKTALELLGAVLKLRNMAKVEVCMASAINLLGTWIDIFWQQVNVPKPAADSVERSPIIFIGHNIGGAIIKQVMGAKYLIIHL